MTKVSIDPGICGFKTTVTAHSEDQQEVEIKVSSGCHSVMNMMKELGSTFDAYELCLVKPGCGPIFEYASEHFPVHPACPVIAGILKCAEAECKLALKKDVEIKFIDE